MSLLVCDDEDEELDSDVIWSPSCSVWTLLVLEIEPVAAVMMYNGLKCEM
jgi:hypothetical protein